MTESLYVCAVVPVFNHAAKLAATLDGVARAGLPCLVVDDGSDDADAAGIARIVATVPSATLLRLARNGGKGAAVKFGLRRAAEAGYTHALQIDADGQHDVADIERFIATARAQPDAVVIGAAQLGRDGPLGRRIARHLTHVWVWINTLSFDIADSMCGFRIYPLAPLTALFDASGDRMEFDVEILVRAHWQGLRVVNVPTRVRYPADGVSHFRLVRDNALISAMHARLFFGMVRRLPQLLWRRTHR
jgi:glycosyltransferase involved in cell wall biosynthesis